MPFRSRTSRSGRAARSCALRRRLTVPTRAPSGASSSEVPAPIQASAGSSRDGTAAISSPSTSSPGRSFAECTPMSARPSSTAFSTARTKRDLSPGSPSEDDLDQLGAAEHVGDHPGLGQRQLARPGGDAQGHALQPWWPGRRSSVTLPARVGFGLDLGLDVETEQFAQGAHVLVGVVGAGGPADAPGRLVQDPRGDRLRHQLDPLAVGLAEALPAVLVLRQHPAHDLVAVLAQRRDRRHDLQRGDPAAGSGRARSR